jgi:hypothetical protein
MLLSHPKKFIFLKTKKTAGTSTEVLFQRWCVPESISDKSAEELHYGDEQISDVGIVGARGSKTENYTFYNHMPAVRIIEHVGIDIWNEYFKFVNVRNPFSRAVSQFFWRRPWVGDRASVLELKRGAKITEEIPELPQLQTYFTQMLKETKRPAVEKFLLTGHPLDFYIRYENLEADIEAVIRKLDLDLADLAKIPNLKAGSWTKLFPDYRVLFNEESRDLVETAYQDWILEFDYKF